MRGSQTIAAFVAASLFELFGAGSAPAAKTKAESPGNEMAVEIHAGGLPIAQGIVNGVGNLRFLMDTGATSTAIDRKLAEKLGLQGQAAQVISFDKKLALESAQIQEISFGPERFSNVRVMIEDLGYLRSLGSRVDGIIGLDLLRRQSFLVDYARKRVVFGPSSTRGMHSVPMYANGRSITVPVELGGRLVRMVADTGAPGTVFYEDTLKDLLANYHLEGRTDALSIGGPVENTTAIVPRLRLGGQDLNREVVLVSAPGASKLSGVSGYLGLASLDAKQVAFSFETNQLLWKK